MSTQRDFPYEYELRKEVLYHPAEPTQDFIDILEIGPGRGDLLFHLAQENPNARILAIEKMKSRYFGLIQRLERRGITNVSLVCGDARIVLPHHFQEGSFGKILVLFSDPWPKERHTFRRLFSLEFLWLLTHQLKKDGFLILATDDPPYAQWIQDRLQEIPALENTLSPAPYASRLPDLPQTYFEEKWRALGKDCYFFKYRKK